MAVIVITGANSGIGLGLTQIYRERGDEVIACVLDSSSELEKSGAEIHAGIDLGDWKAIDKFCAVLSSRSIDALINCAALFLERSVLEETDVANVREELEVNVLGPLKLTQGLLSVLKDEAKIIFISSSLGSIEENETGSSCGYRMSKAAINMLVKNLSIELWSRRISTMAINPGYVKTPITGFSGHISSDEACVGIVKHIDQLSLDTSGTFWHQNGRHILW